MEIYVYLEEGFVTAIVLNTIRMTNPSFALIQLLKLILC